MRAARAPARASLGVDEVGGDEVLRLVAHGGQVRLADRVGECRLERHAAGGRDGIPALRRKLGHHAALERTGSRARIGRQADEDLLGGKRACVAEREHPRNAPRHRVEGAELVLLVVGRRLDRLGDGRRLAAASSRAASVRLAESKATSRWARMSRGRDLADLEVLLADRDVRRQDQEERRGHDAP